jgi:hypothetical protein
MPSEEERQHPVKWSINELERIDDNRLRDKIIEMKRVVETKLLENFCEYLVNGVNMIERFEVEAKALIPKFLDERSKKKNG